MKKGVFLFIVLVFAILSGFVFYLDSSLDCGSVVCLKNYLTGNVIFEEQVLTGNVVITPENQNSLQGFFESLIEVIISPFTGGSGSTGSEGPTLLQQPASCFSVTQYNITWTFNQSYPCGQFINGDWWVLGPVTINSISPTPIYGTNGRSGTVINPISNSQSYDSRAGNYVNNPLTFPRGVSVNSSVVSTISNPDATNCMHPAGPGWIAPTEIVAEGCSRTGNLKTAAVLTVLGSIPADDAFRPAYAGTDKTIKFSESDLNQPDRGYAVLKNLPILPSPALSLSTSERRFQRIALGHQTDWGRSYFTPSDNSMAYGQFYADQVSQAILQLNLAYSNAQKRTLLINFLQTAIDHYGLAKIGMEWQPDGGHSSGREVMIVAGGVILGDLEMTEVHSLPGSCDGKKCFGESGQTFYVNETSPGVWNYGNGGYTSADKGLPEWAHAHDTAHDGNRAWNPSGNDYRHCCTTAEWVGQVLATHLMNIETFWSDRAFIDYTDRYVEVQKAHQSGTYLSPLISYWDNYRNNYGCTWTRDNPSDIYSQGHYNCNGENFRCSWSASTVGTLVISAQDYNNNERAVEYNPCNVDLLSPRLTCPSISQWGITWTFDQPYDCGQFANGDWWIVPNTSNGNVTITGISPGAQNIGGRWVHGSMINPVTNKTDFYPEVDNCSGPGGCPRPVTCPQGYDSRLGAAGEFQQNGYYASWNAGLVNGNPVSPSNVLRVPTSSSLVSTISILNIQPAVPDLQSAAVLTVLNATPPNGAFRPPFMGNDKTIRFTESQLDYGKLANLPLLTGASPTPTPDSLEPIFERPWVEHCIASGVVFPHVPYDNVGQGNYHTVMARNLAHGVLSLNSNFLNTQKRDLLVYLTQLGIDRYAYNSVNFDSTPLLHNDNRKLPVLFAGAVLNNQVMLDVGRNHKTTFEGPNIQYNPNNRDYFSEDGQYFYVNTSTPGGPNWGRGGYNSSDNGLPDWGNTHTARSYGGNYDGINTDAKGFSPVTENYKFCCSGAARFTMALAMHVMNLTDDWSHNAFFDYEDRFVSLNQAGQLTGGSMHWDNGYGEAAWNTYRNNYGCTWTRDNPNDIYSQGYYDCNGAAAGQEYKCTWANSARSTAVLVNSVSDYTSQRAIDYDPCNVALAGPVTIPTAPSGLTVGSPTSSSLTLNWADNSNNENNFVIQRRTGTTGSFVTIATVSAGVTSYLSTGLTANTLYQYQVAANNSAGTSSFTSISSGTTLASGGPGTCNSISQYGITWTFNTNYPCGQFANGDWWVTPNTVGGTVTVTSMSPGTENVGGRQINGAMINPSVSCDSQGYDSSGSLSISYQSGLNVALTMPLVLQTSSSLVSTISNPSTGINSAFPLQTAAILTVLNATPPTGAFRPSYIGNDKTIRHTESQIDYSKLANLPSIASTPSMSFMESQIQRPWLQHCYGWASRNMHPTDNLPNYYREFYSIEGDVALILNTNIPNSQKRNLTVYLSQIGIDWFGYKTTSPPFGADADPIGHTNGKKFPILFAGAILNNPEMLNVGKDYVTRFDSPSSTSVNINYFSEDGQNFYVEETSSNVYNFGFGSYTSAHKGLPDWGNFHTGTWQVQTIAADDRVWSGQLGYRTCCSTVAMIGVDLVMKIMNLTDEWNNNAFRDYNDRYMEIELPSGNIPGNVNQGGYYSPSYTIPDYTTRMWNTYRNNFGCKWERDNAGDIYSNGHYDCGGQDYRCSWSSSNVGTLVNTIADYGANSRAISYDPCNVGLTVPVTNLKFDDTITDLVATDSSGNNLVGTCTSGTCPTYQSTGGQISGAYDFDGVDDRIVVADNNLLDLNTRGSVMAWVRRDTSKWHGVVTKGDAPTHSYGIEIDNSNRAVCQLAGTDYVVTGLTLNAGTYYHIACSWNDGSLTAYVDGVARVTTPSGSSIVANPMTNTGSLYIGTWPSGGPSTGWDWMDGRIDDVRIFNRNLSLTEIQSIFAEGSSPTSPTAPSGLIVSNPTQSSLTLNWTDNSNNENNFTIQRNISGTFTDIATVSANTAGYVNTGLSANTAYQYRVRANNNAGSSAYSNVASGGTLSTGTQTCTGVTQYGITWTFTSSVSCGQFVNGDWWVVGPVTISNKTPSVTSSPARNGDWINPNFNSHVGQPFDDRIGPGQLFSLGPAYVSSMRPSYPIIFNSSNYPAGASLVSTISHPTDGATCYNTFVDTGTTYNQNCNRGPLRVAAVLTVLNSTPSTDAFRPPYNTIDKTVRFTKSQIDYSKLGSLAPSGSITNSQYSIANVNRHLQRVNLQTSFWGNEVVTPSDNANGYGQFMAADVSLASLIVNLNTYTNAQKEPLVISLVQYGIDFYGVYRYSTWTDTGTYATTHNRAAWYGLGGHGQGRLFPILFAGVVLNDNIMRNISSDIPNDYFFSELAQTFTVANHPSQTSGFTALKDILLAAGYCGVGGINCGHGGYTSIDLGLPEFGFSHYHGANNDVRDWYGDAGYRRCCTSNVWNGYALASHAMNITKLWNSQAFFDYVDRYMNVTHSSGPAAVVVNATQNDNWHRGWIVPLYEMWDARRNTLACTWERDNASNNSVNIYSQGHYDCGGQDFRCSGSQSTVGTVVSTLADYGGNQRAIDYNPCNVALSGSTFDFSISRNPISGSVQQGNSVQTTVTATYISGTSSLVTFTATNLSAGVTASFSPSSCTPSVGSSCSSNLTLSASAGATVVSGQSVTISGTSGSTVRTTTYSLTVTAAPTAPAAPSGLIVTTISSSSLRLNWTDNSNNENNFTVERRLVGGSFVVVSTVSANVASYTDTGLGADTTYEYRVRANNNAGSSTYSNVASGTTSQTIPNSPTLLMITPLSSSSLRLNWNDNGNNEDGFIVQYKLTSSLTWLNIPGASNLPVNTTTYTHTSLINNTSYDYRVASYNSAGNSTFATASGTTQQNPVHVYTLSRNPVSGVVQQSGNVQTIVTATYVSGTSSLVTFTATNLSAGVTASFSPSSCTPTSTTPCTSTLTLFANAGATIVNNRQVVIVSNSWLSNINTTYLLNITAPPICTNGAIQLCSLQQGVCSGSQQTCVGNNWPGCNYATIPGYSSIETGVVMCNDGLDNDCDGTRDLGGDSGCPVPSYGSFSQSLTTNFSQVTDFTNVTNFNIGIVNYGRIQFLQNVSLWRLNAGIYSAINLNDAIQISYNSIRINSESYPEFNKSATITFYNLNYSEIPAVMLETSSGLVACPATRCAIQSYNIISGELVLLVSGFSNYTTQASTCGDAFCSSSESCSTCSGDCGACSSGSGSGSGSGGSGGSGGSSSSSGTVRGSVQCSDGLDNDADGKIDFSQDPGCLSSRDNIELDETVLGGEEFEGPTETLVPDNRDIQIGFVFWFVLTILAVGITIVGIIIASYIHKKRKFQEYVQSIIKN